MPYAGDGSFERVPGTLIANQGPLESAQINDETNNAIDGINGKVSLSGLLPMTGVQTIVPGTAAAHAASVSQVQSNVVGHSTAVAGTVDAIQVTMSPADTAWETNELISWKSGGANTVTAPTISKDAGSTTKIIKRGASVALSLGDLGPSGYECWGRYNGTDLLLLNPYVDSYSLAGADITDGAAITIAAIGGYFNLITSTTAITSFSITNDYVGRSFRVRFNTARTLTHNATSLIIPGGANITTAAGDIAFIRSLGSGNVVVEAYIRTQVPPDSGVYTPTLSNTTNVAASTAREARWSRVGNVVTVSGTLELDATTTATATLLGISLPVASDFAAGFELAGTGNATAIFGAFGIVPDVTNNRASLVGIVQTAANHVITYVFSYQVV